MRAFRPSRFAPADEYDEEHQQAKEENLERYAKRAEAGMPLFDPSVGLTQAGPASSNVITGK